MSVWALDTSDDDAEHEEVKLALFSQANDLSAVRTAKLQTLRRIAVDMIMSW